MAIRSPHDLISYHRAVRGPRPRSHDTRGNLRVESASGQAPHPPGTNPGPPARPTRGAFAVASRPCSAWHRTFAIREFLRRRRPARRVPACHSSSRIAIGVDAGRAGSGPRAGLRRARIHHLRPRWTSAGQAPPRVAAKRAPEFIANSGSRPPRSARTRMVGFHLWLVLNRADLELTANSGRQFVQDSARGRHVPRFAVASGQVERGRVAN